MIAGLTTLLVVAVGMSGYNWIPALVSGMDL
jgi:hypothetical protein